MSAFGQKRSLTIARRRVQSLGYGLRIAAKVEREWTRSKRLIKVALIRHLFCQRKSIRLPDPEIRRRAMRLVEAPDQHFDLLPQKCGAVQDGVIRGPVEGEHTAADIHAASLV